LSRDGSASNLPLLFFRWHEHDADEIQQHSDQCVEEAIKKVEEAGWTKDSIKVIGTSPASLCSSSPSGSIS
jgi:hypothetical protein